MNGASLTVEDAFDVDSKDIVPAFFFRNVLEWSTPANARVVDQNV